MFEVVVEEDLDVFVVRSIKLVDDLKLILRERSQADETSF